MTSSMMMVDKIHQIRCELIKKKNSVRDTQRNETKTNSTINFITFNLHDHMDKLHVEPATIFPLKRHFTVSLNKQLQLEMYSKNSLRIFRSQNHRKKGVSFEYMKCYKKSVANSMYTWHFVLR